MSIIILDPVGEFTRSAKGEKGNETFFVNLKETCEKFGKPISTWGIENLVLDRWDLLPSIIKKSEFLNEFTMTDSGKKLLTAEKIAESLQAHHIRLGELNRIETLDSILNDLLADMPIIYSPGRRLNEITNAINVFLADHNAKQTLFDNHLLPVAQHFTPSTTRLGINQVLRGAFDLKKDNRPVVVINLDEQTVPQNMDWDEEIRAILIRSILRTIRTLGNEAYRHKEFLNILLVLDEAQRLVPREYTELKREQLGLRNDIKDAIETVRKFGIGIMSLSTSLSTLHPEVYRQNRISFYGFGLNYGSELDTLRQKVSDSAALKLYQSFRDPHTAFTDDDRVYSFMTMGPCSPLSFSGKPLFLTMFHSPDEFHSINNLQREKKN